MAETAVAPGKPQTLDDVMIAMDVVDTLRHREDLVRRELNEEGREAELIARLREIYRNQGIEVPDHVLADGVKALKESRFVYTPAPKGWKRTLLTLWAKRDSHGKVAGIALALLVGGWTAHHVLVTRPAEQAAEQARIEITETLPKALRQAYADAIGVAADEAVKQKANALLADGERAIRSGDRAAMSQVSAELAALRDDVAHEYTLTIVSRPGESSGVWRRPPGNSQARNHYLIVEPIAPDGRKLSIRVRNEETGATEIVSKFGVRVSQQVYDAAVQDKRDDGIIQRNRFGVKRRGTLAVDYQMPFEGGFVTKW
ncbi:MAG: DUF6384 family protein [Hyphomicrobiaceae bacterium]|jgi:hypothetical protein